MHIMSLRSIVSRVYHIFPKKTQELEWIIWLFLSKDELDVFILFIAVDCVQVMYGVDTYIIPGCSSMKYIYLSIYSMYLFFVNCMKNI